MSNRAFVLIAKDCIFSITNKLDLETSCWCSFSNEKFCVAQRAVVSLLLKMNRTGSFTFLFSHKGTHDEFCFSFFAQINIYK